MSLLISNISIIAILLVIITTINASFGLTFTTNVQPIINSGGYHHRRQPNLIRRSPLKKKFGGCSVKLRGGGNNYNYDDNDSYGPGEYDGPNSSGSGGGRGSGRQTSPTSSSYQQQGQQPNDFSDRYNSYNQRSQDAYQKLQKRSRSNSSYDRQYQNQQSTIQQLINKLNIFSKNNRQLGFTLTGVGTLLTLLSIVLFFEKNLMRLGNLLFLSGIPLIIGPSRTLGYFTQKSKIRASGCLAAGILLVFYGRPIIGICLEIFGIMNLFGNMFPLVFGIVKRLPIVGDLFDVGKKKKGKMGEGGYYGDRQW